MKIFDSGSKKALIKSFKREQLKSNDKYLQDRVKKGTDNNYFIKTLRQN